MKKAGRVRTGLKQIFGGTKQIFVGTGSNIKKGTSRTAAAGANTIKSGANAVSDAGKAVVTGHILGWFLKLDICSSVISPKPNASLNVRGWLKKSNFHFYVCKPKSLSRGGFGQSALLKIENHNEMIRCEKEDWDSFSLSKKFNMKRWCGRHNR